MTPKKQAEKLVWKYYNVLEHTISDEYSSKDWEIAKESALIAVDELIIQNGELYLNGLNGSYYTEKNNFLFEVKKEIEKL